MRNRPVIGVTLDAEEPGGYSKLPWYALRKNYFSCLAEAGALPIALPHHPELAGSYLDRIDGLLITGQNPGSSRRTAETLLATLNAGRTV